MGPGLESSVPSLSLSLSPSASRRVSSVPFLSLSPRLQHREIRDHRGKLDCGENSLSCRLSRLCPAVSASGARTNKPPAPNIICTRVRKQASRKGSTILKLLRDGHVMRAHSFSEAEYNLICRNGDDMYGFASLPLRSTVWSH